MSDILDAVKFFLEFDSSNLNLVHITIAGGLTIVVYFLLFIINKFIRKQSISFMSLDFLIKCGIALVVEFLIIWLYGPKLMFISMILGMILAIYIRNKFFSFIDTNPVSENDIKVKSDLNELKTKFKKNPYYSILEVLLYYGYISSLQKETVESENIFKTPDEMAKEFLNKPILTVEQLDEAIGIMNMIRREGKILTREEALLLIMNMDAKHPDRSNDVKTTIKFVPDVDLFDSDGNEDNQDVGD